MDQKRQRQPGERGFGIMMLGLGLFLAWQAYGIAGFEALSSPGAFPMAAAAAMVIAGAVVVVGDWRAARRDRPRLAETARAFTAEITPSVVVIFAGFVIGYAALLDTLGFLPSSFLFLFAAIHFLHRGPVVLSFGVTLLALTVIYAVFRLVFQVILPEGIVPEREIMAWLGGLVSGGAQ